MDWKPTICWQVPIFTSTDDETNITQVRACRQTDWGRDGILNWWCTETPDAFTATQPLYVTMEPELRRVAGDAVYDELAAYCQARNGVLKPPPVLLPMAS